MSNLDPVVKREAIGQQRGHLLPVVLVPVVPDLHAHHGCQLRSPMQLSYGKRYEHMTGGTAS